LRVARIVAVWLVLSFPACTENWPLLEPAGIATEGGTLRFALLARLSPTVVPPLEAADNVAVHAE